MPVKEHGGISGELIPRMVWNAVPSPCVESTDFIEFYDFLVNLFDEKNGFEMRCEATKIVQNSSDGAEGLAVGPERRLLAGVAGDSSIIL